MPLGAYIKRYTILSLENKKGAINMSQADGTHTLDLMEFSYSGGSYKFNLNPQSMKMSQPHRTSVIKTQSTYVVEDFNDDIQSIQISGTTGGPRILKGEQAIMNMWNFLDKYANQIPAYGQAPQEPLEFYNHTENYAFATVLAPDGYSITRDVSHPLQWNYEINLIVLGVAGAVIDPSTISGAEITSRDTNKGDTNRQTQIGPMPNTNVIAKGTGYSAPTQSSKSNAGTKQAIGNTVKNPVTGKPQNTPGSVLSNWAKGK